MAEEGVSTNSDWILVEKEKNDFEKLETNSDNLQKSWLKEKEKSGNLEKENNFLENQLKEMNKVRIFFIEYFKIIFRKLKK
ncbi:unnamed protein product [Meloidogyne enterolobii]|uniref:Uncharacterized protein n=1 Tax=Meloidogyne enterolobii TaxID=390850 RepID=A0ACB0YN80_MELEN